MNKSAGFDIERDKNIDQVFALVVRELDKRNYLQEYDREVSDDFVLAVSLSLQVLRILKIESKHFAEFYMALAMICKGDRDLKSKVVQALEKFKQINGHS